MKDPEELLKKAPRKAPSEKLDQTLRAVFEEAKQSAKESWFAFRIPAWSAGLACLFCLLIGWMVSPRQVAEPISTPPEEPEVLVEYVPNPNQTFLGLFSSLDESEDTGFFSTEWTWRKDETL